jgi:hypothetical protein
MKDPVTPEDYKLGRDILKEYPLLNLNDLYCLFNTIRGDLANIENSINIVRSDIQMTLSELKEKLSSGTKIRNIVINTDKGPLVMWNYGNVYHNLIVAAKKAIPKLKDDLKSISDKIKKHDLSIPFIVTARTILRTSLGPDQKKVVIGMIAAHFKFWNIMTREEHKRSKNISTWKQYLSKNVESKLITISQYLTDIQ